ncbi:hypothetical protein XENTR_v10016999 [Xenopus tropicalis]|uniref:Centrosome and spindle pole-associated protein 1 isoform X3 n=1 Tax=Xenopus tropicalis TaxID=8364 RepID=A0A8J1JP06_XENTR|nr:centrosome and spindle pole-associated protein 1 isoform X3 [Xenopus tropicalis]KAE8598938.1 hypothetical protein XENTR_v10016999 [Xenopus tropicalis]
MGEELDQFIEEQKAKLALDKAELDKDPPYMEIRSKRSETSEQPHITLAKENIPPNRQGAPKKQSGDYELSLPLGEDYERKKLRLKEELRQDYRRYLSQKHLRTTGEIDPFTQGMSLPIGERLSAKERLRLERNKEYNQFLRMKDVEHDQLILAAAQDPRIDRVASVNRVNPDPHPSLQLSHRDPELSKKDAYTSMEAYEQLLNKRRSEEDRHRRVKVQVQTQEQHNRRAEEELAMQNRVSGRRDRDLEMLDRPHHIAANVEYERRPLRFSLAPAPEDSYSRFKYEIDAQDRRHNPHNNPSERLLSRRHIEDSYEYHPEQASYYHVQKNNKSYKEMREPEPPIDYEDDFREPRSQRPVTSIAKARVKTENNTVQNIERSKSAKIKEENFSTGLFLGGSDKDETQQRRKERYRQELMEQMAEQQRNKRREKELELKVAASGAIDPEKQPDRLRQFGAINRHQELADRNVPYRPGAVLEHEKTGRRSDPKPALEERVPPERPRVAFQTPVPEVADSRSNISGVPALPNEEYHRGLASTFGDIVAPRIAAVPPPQAPVLTENYRTPYDDAYYFYGARNPLDPSIAYYPPGAVGLQPVQGVSIPVTQILQNQSEDQFYVNKQGAAGGRGTSLGFLPEEKPRQSKAAAMSYQEELERQILEKNEKRRKEKEEHERYEAKLDAEMRNYNPWGKGGGGAPLKDAKGNLITDLKKMHKQNEDGYQNPEARPIEDKRTVVAVEQSLADNTGTASKISDGRGEYYDRLSDSMQRHSGFSFASNNPFARGNVFSEPPSEQQVHQQESYKNFLRLQIEEKRQKEEEERERLRLEEEREERKLAEQRALIQREYEEEQNKKKLKEEENRQKNEELIRLAEDRRKEAERKRKEEEEREEEEERRRYELERAAKVSEEHNRPPRQPSPLIPTMQNKDSQVQRPPTTDGYVSSRTHKRDEPQSRNVSPPVPARRNQLRLYDEKKNVISELSELKRQLRSEQKRLEGQLHDADRDDVSSASMTGRRREKHSMDAFDLARQRLQANVRRPSLKGTDVINMQNIREFNDLKYRDTETREGVRHMYPDPPKDDQTLEIQQQALLREQQRNLNRMKRRTIMPDFETAPAPAYSLRHNGMFRDPSQDLMKTSLLESESAFIGENGEPFAFFMDPSADSHQVPSARERRRHKNKPLDLDNDIPMVPPIPLHQPDRLSLHSGSSVNVDELRARNEERLRRLSNFRKSSPSRDNEALGDDEDILRYYPAKSSARPHSVDTVATEPWLRPGTSETLKRFMAGQDKAFNDGAFNLNLQGLSTAHG